MGMDEKQAAKRLEELRDEIRKHDRLYYDEAAPIISDRAKSGRRRGFARLRERQAPPGGDARRRKRGRQYYAEHPDYPLGAGAAPRCCAETSGSARRSLHGPKRLRRTKRGTQEGRAATVCKPPQRRGRLAQATRPSDRG